MNENYRGHRSGASVLATDLDGTFIPLSGSSRNQADLATLAQQLVQHDTRLVFVTGRHLESVERAIAEYSLPRPDWIICDVGTTIYQSQAAGPWHEVAGYRSHLESIVADCPTESLQQQLCDITDLRLQEAEKQGRFKLSYYAPPSQIASATRAIQARLERVAAPYSMISSIDPFTGEGLVDLLPKDVSKAHALQWWVAHAGLAAESIVFAGDSGNDLAALLAGYLTIVVGNADRQLAGQVDQIHREYGWQNRLCLARGHATSGVLEGCRWFGMLPGQHNTRPTATRDRLGATPKGADGTHFRVWAPHRKSLQVELRTANGLRRHPLQRHANGYFTGIVAGVTAGDQYQYCIDDTLTRPDPASRFQPDGVHGNSQVVDSQAYDWQDEPWSGVPKRDLIIYELHIGTFSEQGTFAAAEQRLDELQQLGITAVEIMPVAQTPGRWNWGYDGVNLFAVRNTYGTPDQFRSFVDACHSRGMAVILDVVYNHVGPEGNYLADFAPYFSHKHHTPWGDAFDFDGPNAGPVRRFIVENAISWLDEFHLDGLRLDAVHFMLDDSEYTILDELRDKVAQFAASTRRHIHLIAESNVYDHELVSPQSADRMAYDAIWCDDVMHSIYSLAGPQLCLAHREYLGATDLHESLQHGYIYSGPVTRRSTALQRRELHGTAGNSYLESFVAGLQTHDCVGNHPRGQRLHQLASTEFQQAAAALVLLYPTIPLIFMGEERAADSPFCFFVDFHDPQLRRSVARGRAREFPRHVWRTAVSPIDEQAFYNSKCVTAGDQSVMAWYRSLIEVRKQWRSSGRLDARYLQVDCQPDSHLYALRYVAPAASDLFVLARLQPLGESPADTTLHIEGEVILDSWGEAVGMKDGTVTLRTNRALVGVGRFSAAGN